MLCLRWSLIRRLKPWSGCVALVDLPHVLPTFFSNGGICIITGEHGSRDFHTLLGERAGRDEFLRPGREDGVSAAPGRDLLRAALLWKTHLFQNGDVYEIVDCCLIAAARLFPSEADFRRVAGGFLCGWTRQTF